jgi:hypothetical protein
VIQIKATGARVGHLSVTTDGDETMPVDTILVLSGVLAAFAFFAATLTYSDMTWEPRHRRN